MRATSTGDDNVYGYEKITADNFSSGMGTVKFCIHGMSMDHRFFPTCIDIQYPYLLSDNGYMTCCYKVAYYLSINIILY